MLMTASCGETHVSEKEPDRSSTSSSAEFGPRLEIRDGPAALPAARDQEHPPKAITELGVDFEILPGEVHVYEIVLEAGSFVYATVQEQGFDVELRLVGPDQEEPVASADTPTNGYGLEELAFIVDRAGTYHLEVAALDKPWFPKGQVRLEIPERGPATELHRTWAAARQSLVQAQVLFEAQEYEAAMGVSKELLATWERLERPQQQIETLRLLGNAYSRLEEPELAEASFSRAVELARSPQARPWLAGSLNKLGQSRLQLGDVRRGASHFQDAVALYEALHLYRQKARTLLQLGAAQHRLGNLEAALSSYEEALEIMAQHPVREIDRAYAREAYGTLLLVLQRLWDAGRQLEWAGAIYAQLGDSLKQAESFKRRAHIAYRLGDLDDAEALLNRAEDHLAQVDSSSRKRHRVEATFHLLWGRLRMAQQSHEASQASIRRALVLAEESGVHQLVAICHLELGRSLRLQEQPLRGLAELERALDLFVRLDSPAGQAIAGVRSAEALKDLGRLDEARQRVEPALKMAEAHRSLLDRHDARTDYFAFRQDFFDISIDILMLLHEFEPTAGHHLKALEVHEHRRARGLFDNASQGVPHDADLASDSPLMVRERTLQDELSHSLSDEQSEESTRILNELQEVRGAIWQQRSLLRVAEAPSLPKLSHLQEALADEDSLVLVYGLLESQSHLWTILDGKVEDFPLPSRLELELYARRFASQLPRLSREGQQEREEAGRELSKRLLGPVASKLGHRRLVIVASGALQNVAFSALPQPGGAPADYLLLRHEIIMLPSLSSWVRLRALEAGRPPPKQGVLALGDPVFRSDDPRLEHPTGKSTPPRGGLGEARRDELLQEESRSLRYLAQSSDTKTLARLTGSRREVEAIRALLGDDVEIHMDLEARRSAFLRPDLPEFRVLHLATHAFQHPKFPDLSGFVLSLVDDQGRPVQGYVRAFEVSPLHLGAELAVLSACETGRGKQVRGEGVLGLARAFFDAGVPRVISSFWKVEDQATADLMSKLYSAYVSEGETPSAALRRAQLKTLEESSTAEPYYWAGFVFQGDWRRPESRE